MRLAPAAEGAATRALASPTAGGTLAMPAVRGRGPPGTFSRCPNAPRIRARRPICPPLLRILRAWPARSRLMGGAPPAWRAGGPMEPQQPELMAGEPAPGAARGASATPGADAGRSAALGPDPPAATDATLPARGSVPGPAATAHADCCVIGGGPAGAMLALLLARQGVRVTLLEQHHDFDRDFRGDTLHPSVLEILDQLGLAQRVLALPHAELHQASLMVEGRPVFAADFSHL